MIDPRRKKLKKEARKLLKKEKKLLKMSELKPINPPHYDEISVRNLYDRCLELPGMADYFPDAYPKGRVCSRKYFFDVLNTLHPKQTQAMIANAKRVRVIDDDDEEQKNKQIRGSRGA